MTVFGTDRAQPLPEERAQAQVDYERAMDWALQNLPREFSRDSIFFDFAIQLGEQIERGQIDDAAAKKAFTSAIYHRTLFGNEVALIDVQPVEPNQEPITLTLGHLQLKAEAIDVSRV